jgi:hypothetical protein
MVGMEKVLSETLWLYQKKCLIVFPSEKDVKDIV